MLKKHISLLNALNTQGFLRSRCPYLRSNRGLNCTGDTSEMSALVLGTFSRPGSKVGEDVAVLTEAALKVDDSIDGRLSNAIRLAGPVPRPGEVRLFYGLMPSYSAVGVVGLGGDCQGYVEEEEIDELKESIRNATGMGARVLQDAHMKTLWVDSMGHAESAAEGAAMGAWIYQQMKSQQKGIPKIEPFETCDLTGWQIGLQKAAAQNLARQLAETPANHLTPSGFSQIAVQVLTTAGVSVEVKVKEWSHIMKLFGFLTAAKGSCESPMFVEIHYYGCDPDVAPAVLIGKGVTFDSGGICLKSCKDMKNMRGDMTGAAVVVAATRAASALQLPINIRGIIPLYENMPGPCAMKPGDIIRSKNGKTILINETDYDGRLALADAITYSMMYNPKFITSIATSSNTLSELFGEGPVATFSNNDSLFETLRIAGIHTGDRVWRMPLWKHYTNKVRQTQMSDIQDRVENFAAPDRLVYSGLPPQTAAFLNEFVPNTDWAHVDLFNALYTDGNAFKYLRKGMSGRPTRTIVEFLAQLSCHLSDSDEATESLPKPTCAFQT